MGLCEEFLEIGFYERIVCKYRLADLAALATDQAYDLSSKHNYNSLCNFFFFFFCNFLVRILTNRHETVNLEGGG